MNQDTIRIINEGAKELEASIISIFQTNDTNEKYTIYTFNEEDAQGLVKIYASRIVEAGGLYSFVSISTADEWAKVKDVMKYMAKTDDADGTNGGKISLIPVTELKKKAKEPISVNLSETKAAKIGPNYKMGIINCYVKHAKDVVPEVKQEKAPEQSSINLPKFDEKPVEVNIPDLNIPSFEIPKQATTKIEMPTSIETPIVEPKIEEEITPKNKNVDVDINKKEEKVEEKPTPMDIPAFEMPKVDITEAKSDEEEKNDETTPDYSFEPPKFEDDFDEDTKEEVPNVDSILNKASYYQNIKEEEEPKQSSENVIQNIGLEFMKKVSELAEYEKELNRKSRDLEARERILTKLEKEISSKEERQKNLNQANKKKEIELRKYEKELDDRDSDLNRRIIEFNKKISMFQQTFETISKVN